MKKILLLLLFTLACEREKAHNDTSNNFDSEIETCGTRKKAYWIVGSNPSGTLFLSPRPDENLFIMRECEKYSQQGAFFEKMGLCRPPFHIDMINNLERDDAERISVWLNANFRFLQTGDGGAFKLYPSPKSEDSNLICQSASTATREILKNFCARVNQVPQPTIFIPLNSEEAISIIHALNALYGIEC